MFTYDVCTNPRVAAYDKFLLTSRLRVAEKAETDGRKSVDAKIVKSINEAVETRIDVEKKGGRRGEADGMAWPWVYLE